MPETEVVDFLAAERDRVRNCPARRLLVESVDTPGRGCVSALGKAVVVIGLGKTKEHFPGFSQFLVNFVGLLVGGQREAKLRLEVVDCTLAAGVGCGRSRSALGTGAWEYPL